MKQSIDEAVGSVSDVSGDLIDAQNAEQTQDVDGLRALRQIAGKAQADVAAALKIKQPSVSKIEKQVDMHLSTLRNYVAAIGGKLELTVKLPRRRAVRIHALGEVVTALSSVSEQGRESLGKVGTRR